MNIINEISGLKQLICKIRNVHYLKNKRNFSITTKYKTNIAQMHKKALFQCEYESNLQIIFQISVRIICIYDSCLMFGINAWYHISDINSLFNRIIKTYFLSKKNPMNKAIFYPQDRQHECIIHLFLYT